MHPRFNRRFLTRTWSKQPGPVDTTFFGFIIMWSFDFFIVIPVKRLNS